MTAFEVSASWRPAATSVAWPAVVTFMLSVRPTGGFRISRSPRRSSGPNLDLGAVVRFQIDMAHTGNAIFEYSHTQPIVIEDHRL